MIMLPSQAEATCQQDSGFVVAQYQSFQYWKGLVEFMKAKNLASIWLKMQIESGSSCVNEECESRVKYPGDRDFNWSLAINDLGIRTLDLSQASFDAVVLTSDMRIQGVQSSSQHSFICQSDCQITSKVCPKAQTEATLNGASVEVRSFDKYIFFPATFNLRYSYA